MRLLNLWITPVVSMVLLIGSSIRAHAQQSCTAIQVYPAKETLAVGEQSELIVTTGYSRNRFTELPIVLPPGAMRTGYEVNVIIDDKALPTIFIAEPNPLLFYDPKVIKSFRVPITFDSPGLKRLTVSTPHGARSEASPVFCSYGLPATASTEILVEAKPVVAPLAVGYSGLWWNPRTNGQGVFITQNTPSNIAYLGWFTYDQTGVARWYVGDNCAVQNNSCVTIIYETKGATFDGANFNNANLKLDAVGTATVTFASNQAATMVYTLKTSGGKLDLVRQPF